MRTRPLFAIVLVFSVLGCEPRKKPSPIPPPVAITQAPQPQPPAPPPEITPVAPPPKPVPEPATKPVEEPPRPTLAQLRRRPPVCGVLCTIRTVYTKRAEKLPTRHFAEWIAAIEKLAGGRVDRNSLYASFPKKMSVLFYDDETGSSFRDDLSGRFVKRLGSVSPEQFSQWKAAVAGALGNGAADWSVALTLAAIGRLYDESDRFDPQKAMTCLRRLRGLSRKSVDRWIEKMGYEISADDAAISVVLVDEFFPDGTFDEKVFEDALK